MRTKPRDQPYCGANAALIASAEPIISPVMLKTFVQYVTRRYHIHIKRDVQADRAPWTTDDVLLRWRFTNVRREHDTQTKALLASVSLNPNLSFEEKVLNTILFRTWNNKDTFRFFELPITADRLYSGRAMKLARAKLNYFRNTFPSKFEGRNWWNEAYSQTGMKTMLGNRDYKNTDKYDYDTREPDVPLRPFHVPMWLNEWNTVPILLNAHNQAEAYDYINSVPGYGAFIAYQIFVDLTYIAEFPFSENEFVIAGPGCKRGMNHVFIDYGGLSHAEGLFWLRDNWNDLMVEYSIPWDAHTLMVDLPEWDRYMNVMSIENCFCEFQKYVRRLDQKPRKERYV